MEWRGTASLSAEGDLKFDDAVLAGTPVDILVASVAACFMKSCHLAQGARSTAQTRVEVDVTATKADGRPNRLGAIRIAWAMPELDEAEASRIAKDAKRICTVTNSMSCDFEVVAL